jgi:ATP-dependent protease ClpP protease subunit
MADAELEKVKNEKEELNDKKINEYGQITLENKEKNVKIHLLSIIGEVEGHECLPQHNKTTKYEHILPQLAAIEDSQEIDGLLILINTVGGDVEAGLAIAEMIASLSKPTVSLVLGGSHSIGVPLATSAQYSFIVPSGTMIIHPVRMNGMVIGVTQTFEYFQRIQDRILNFVVNHSNIEYEELKDLMLATLRARELALLSRSRLIKDIYEYRSLKVRDLMMSIFISEISISSNSFFSVSRFK